MADLQKTTAPKFRHRNSCPDGWLNAGATVPIQLTVRQEEYCRQAISVHRFCYNLAVRTHRFCRRNWLPWPSWMDISKAFTATVLPREYNRIMTTINDISDLVRILREQPDWAEALRALLLTQQLLDLPGRFDRFVEIQQETNRLTAQRLEAIETRMDNVDGRLGNVEGRLGNVEGRLGNLEGGQYERTVRTKVLARTQIVLGFDGARVALNQEGLVDSQLNSAVARAVRDGRVSEDGYAGLFEADLVISARDNRHAVVEVSITADEDDIIRAKERSGILADVTGGTVTPVVITSRLDPAQAEAEGVRIFVIPYP